MAGNSGRPRDLYLTYVRAMFPEWSERTVARFARATRLLCLTGCSAEVRERVLRRGRRPWGGFNVAAYLKAAEDVAAARLVDQDEAGQSESDQPGD